MPWEEVVSPHSPYFPDGAMTVEVTMKPIKQDSGGQAWMRDFFTKVEN